MLMVYINYPNSRITIHNDDGCPTIQKQHKEGQRVLKLDVATLSGQLERFATNAYRFAANHNENDMWLNVEFDDPVFELAVINYVRKLLGRHYGPFERIEINEHNCPE